MYYLNLSCIYPRHFFLTLSTFILLLSDNGKNHMHLSILGYCLALAGGGRLCIQKHICSRSEEDDVNEH
jgi:hypothetical protein